MASSSIKQHIQHTNADITYATQKLNEGYSRDEVVSLLQSDMLLGAKGAVTCVAQILWGQAGGDKVKQAEISDWQHKENLKILRNAEQLKKGAQILLQLSQNTGEGKKGGKRKGVSRTQKKNKKRKTRGRK